MVVIQIKGDYMTTFDDAKAKVEDAVNDVKDKADEVGHELHHSADDALKNV